MKRIGRTAQKYRKKIIQTLIILANTHMCIHKNIKQDKIFIFYDCYSLVLLLETVINTSERYNNSMNGKILKQK